MSNGHELLYEAFNLAKQLSTNYNKVKVIVTYERMMSAPCLDRPGMVTVNTEHDSITELHATAPVEVTE